jgi:putative transposase
MPKKRFSAEQIVTLLRQIEVFMAQGKSTPEACRESGISQQNYAAKRRDLPQSERSTDRHRAMAKHYNTIRPHSALNYRSPAPQTFAPTTAHLDAIVSMQ